MKLSIILALLKIVTAIMSYLERERWKAEGRAEVNAEAKKAHDERVAQANAARADADELSSLHVATDPRNRDNLR
jgi:Na+-transporting methylmalonyl-CoA/oxaloacetate decarboxylase gamma subunit